MPAQVQSDCAGLHERKLLARSGQGRSENRPLHGHSSRENRVGGVACGLGRVWTAFAVTSSSERPAIGPLRR